SPRRSQTFEARIKCGLLRVIMYDGWIAALISFTGVVCNLTVAIFARKLTSLKNAFGRLSASQAAGEAMLCATFALYYTPMVLLYVGDDAVDRSPSKHALENPEMLARDFFRIEAKRY
ncbi:hypothetical protein OESDEN_22568, partial [Oesophagostomum dentatum]